MYISQFERLDKQQYKHSSVSPLLWTSWSAGPTLWWVSEWAPWLPFGLEGPSASQTWAPGRQQSYRCQSWPWQLCLCHLKSPGQSEVVKRMIGREIYCAITSHKCLIVGSWSGEVLTYLSLDRSRDFVTFFHDAFIHRVTETWNHT